MGMNISSEQDYYDPNIDEKIKKLRQIKKNYYNESVYQEVPDTDIAGVYDNLRNVAGFRNKQPLNYYEGPQYQHRANFNMTDQFHLRVGDSFFVIPPEFISIRNLSSTQSVTTLRQKDSAKLKNAYVKREITMTMFFNGLEQINGYKVESPEPGKHYYVDGLRPLLAQFKCTPFLPVHNEYLNNNFISAVALVNITVNTVQGFPNCLYATLILVEFNAEAYTSISNELFDDCIDWDLFRYYYQRLLNDIPSSDRLLETKKLIPIPSPFGSNGQTSVITNNLELKLLKPEVLYNIQQDEKDNKPGTRTQDEIDFNDDKNFVSKLKLGEDMNVIEISCAFSNILPYIQLSNHSSPTMQYIGSTDTMINISFEVHGSENVQKITDLVREISETIRNYREVNSIGFLKIENDFVSYMGVTHVMINEINTSTIPDFPDIFRVDMQCISYDISQKDREGLFGFRPFKDNRHGTAGDAIIQNQVGWFRKIRQDVETEEAMMRSELYPDLSLPRYDEINNHIVYVKLYRAKHNLPQLQYSQYELPRFMKPKFGPRGEYDIYVDPDFYFFYPMRFVDLNGLIGEDINTPHMKPQEARIVNDFGEEENEDSEMIPSNAKSNFNGSNSVVREERSWNSNASADLNPNLGNNNTDGDTYWPDSDVSYKDRKDDELRLIAMNLYHKVCASPNAAGNTGGLYGDTNLLNLGPYWNGSFKGEYSKSQFAGKDPMYNNTVIYKFVKQFDALCKANNLDTLYMLALSCHESWNGTYPPHIEKFNYGSIMISGQQGAGGMVVNTSASDGMAKYVALLKNNYYDKGLKTISAQMGKYNPAGMYDQIYAVLDHIRSIGNVNIVKNQTDGQVQTNQNKLKQDVYKQELNRSMSDEFISIGVNTGNIDKFGEPIFSISPTAYGKREADILSLLTLSGKEKAEQKHYDAYQLNMLTRADEVIQRACVDMKYFSCTGTMLKAFPTFVFAFLDDGGEWLDGRKLWSNCYLYKSIIDISVTHEYGQPTGTAIVRMSNLYENLSRKTSGSVYSMKDDPEYAGPLGLNKLLIEKFGMSLIGPKLTAEMVRMKNLLYSNIFVKAGCRIHIRMGYGSNPLGLPICFNGTIAEIDTNDSITLVAQSDGVELINNLVEHQKEDAKNGMFRFGSESSDIISSILLERAGWWRSNLFSRIRLGNEDDKKRAVEGSAFGDKSNADGIAESENHDGTVSAHYGADEYITDNTPAYARTGNYSNAIASKPGNQNNFYPRYGEWSKFGIEHFGIPSTNAGALAIPAIALVGDITTSIITAGMIKSDFSAINPRTYEYDVLKNIYKGDYSNSPFCMGTEENWVKRLFDAEGEKNINMFLYNRTPWDVFKLCEQNEPEYICQPVYHQFDSRVFYGLPQYSVKYRYDYINSVPHECAKTFEQFHYIGLNEIVDNQVFASSRRLHQNYVGVYSLDKAGNLRSTPVLFSDRSIAPHVQKTATVDTTIIQDLFCLDFLDEWVLRIKPGKYQAVRIGISNIIDSWKNTYDGSLIILGEPSIKPCDQVFVNDAYRSMIGLVNVRAVTHTFGIDTGLITDIQPGMNCVSNLQSAGRVAVYNSYMRFGTQLAKIDAMAKTQWVDFVSANTEIRMLYTGMRALGSRLLAGYMTYKTTKMLQLAMANMTSMKTFFTTVRNGVEITKKAGIVANIGKGVGNIYSMARTAFAGTAIASTLKNAGVIRNGITGVRTIVAGLSFTNIFTAVLYIIIDILLGWLIEAAIDFFEYQNCVTVFPVYYRDKPLTSGTYGAKKLIPGYIDTGVDFIESE